MKTTHRRLFWLPVVSASIATALLLVPAMTWAGLVEVNTCGQEFRGRGFLTADLDCTGFADHAVIIERGRLELRGFTLTGGNAYGVRCIGSCKIVGPGTITRSGLDGVRVQRRVTILNVNITNNDSDGVDARNNRGNAGAVVKESVITGNGSSGVQADRRAKLFATTISANGQHGVEIGKFRCDRPTRLLVRDSTIVGNGVDVTCGVSRTCADVATCDTPRLSGVSSCQTSYDLSSGFPGSSWGVCSLD
jgi:hypothetical protein